VEIPKTQWFLFLALVTISLPFLLTMFFIELIFRKIGEKSYAD